MNFEALSNQLKSRISLEEIKEQDPQTFLEMFEQNVLFVEQEDIANKRVLDVGAYMGFFSMLALGMEATEVLAVEAHPENYQKLVSNAARFDNMLPLFSAIFDGKETSVSMVESKGVAKALPGGNVPAIGLGELLTMLPEEDNNLVLKLDTEGAEYDILLNASGNDIRRFETIFLETHQVPHLPKKAARRALYLRQYLDMLGFKVIKERFVYNWKEDGSGGYEWYNKIDDQESMKLKRID